MKRILWAVGTYLFFRWWNNRGAKQSRDLQPARRR